MTLRELILSNWLRNVFNLVAWSGIPSIWAYWSHNNDRDICCLRENGNPWRSFWYCGAVQKRWMKCLQEQGTAASPSKPLVAWLEIPALHVLFLCITVCNKYIVGGAVHPRCSFSPKLKRFRMKCSKFENTLVLRWISKPMESQSLGKTVLVFPAV